MYVLPDILLIWLAVGLIWETDVMISSASSRSTGACSSAATSSYYSSTAPAFSSTATWASSIFWTGASLHADAATDGAFDFYEKTLGFLLAWLPIFDKSWLFGFEKFDFYDFGPV